MSINLNIADYLVILLDVDAMKTYSFMQLLHSK